MLHHGEGLRDQNRQDWLFHKISAVRGMCCGIGFGAAEAIAEETRGVGAKDNGDSFEAVGEGVGDVDDRKGG